jgi:hypothetical protein
MKQMSVTGQEVVSPEISGEYDAPVVWSSATVG